MNGCGLKCFMHKYREKKFAGKDFFQVTFCHKNTRA